MEKAAAAMRAEEDTAEDSIFRFLKARDVAAM